MTSIGAGTSTNARVFDNRLARHGARQDSRAYSPFTSSLSTRGAFPARLASSTPAAGGSCQRSAPESCWRPALRMISGCVSEPAVHETLALDFRGEGVRGASAAGRASFFGMSRRLCSREART